VKAYNYWLIYILINLKNIGILLQGVLSKFTKIEINIKMKI